MGGGGKRNISCPYSFATVSITLSGNFSLSDLISKAQLLTPYPGMLCSFL